MDKPRVRVFLDDDPQPIIDQELPGDVTLATRGIADGPHRPFDPRRAEARSSIPVWVWVMSLFVVAWAVWYAARMWDVPQAYAQTPTYRSQAPAR